VYDTITNKVNHLTPMPQWRTYYAMTLLADGGGIFACGGMNAGAYLPTCVLYNIKNNTWTTLPALTSIAHFTMIILGDDKGRPYVFGGMNATKAFPTVYIIDMANNDWLERAPIPVTSLVDHSTVALNNTYALVCGGLVGTTVQSLCHTYSSTANLWTTAQPLNVSRSEHGMTVYKGTAH
jgi:N-acetylneuraminic acid mutarotase